MSNNTVGNIYQQIINEVISSSQADFEDNGVDEAVIEDLRKGWQAKLTGLKIASFPWDPPPPAPAPAPAPAAAPVTTAPPAAAAAAAAPAQQNAAASYTSAQLSPPSNAQPLPSLANGLPGPQKVNSPPAKTDATARQEPAIKQEPSSNISMPAPSSGTAPHGLAAQRAMSQLQNQYGSRAAASISAIQGFGQGGQGQAPSAAPRPASTAGQPNQAQRPPQQAQYSQQIANQTAAMAQQQQQQQQQQRPGQPTPHAGQQQNGFQQSQVDGAGDSFEGVLMRRDENGETSEMGRVDIDRMLHEQIAAKAKQMEGGGLMLPLKQATKHKSIAKKTRTDGPSAYDGIDDDINQDEEDEDAINSDLDDPNEVNISEEDNDDNITHIMLCMYDKVQRVKNKWKCTLKDGVLNVNGKDYVFHKATGEYEW